MENDTKIMVAITLGLVATVALMVRAVERDEAEWKVYSAQHHCRAVGTKEGQLVSGWAMSPDGKSMVQTFSMSPDQTIYNCDDGEMRIR